MRGRRSLLPIGAVLVLVILSVAIATGAVAGSPVSGSTLSAASAAGSGCQPAGSTGLTADVIAHSFEYISGTVNATGCDVGVYVGPGTTFVVIEHATITGANDHGIFVEDASTIIIMHDVVEHNGLASHKCATNQTTGCINEDKAIELVGTTDSWVVHNLVAGNMADGGIGIADDGPIDPGAINPGTLHAATNNMVLYNQVVDNAGGCGIVLAAYNAGAGVTGNVVYDNQVSGSAPGTGPFVGGIVVAADSPGTVASQNYVSGNLIEESLIPGVVVHSNAPGDVVYGNAVYDNVILKNGLEGPPNDPTVPTGIEVVAEVFPGEPTPPVLDHTAVFGNVISDDAIGVWTCHATNTTVFGTTGNATTPMASC